MIRKLKKKMSDRVRLRYVVSGVLLIYISLIAQFTSTYTPLLASYTPTFAIMSHIGSYTLLVALLVYVGSFVLTNQKPYFFFSVVSAIALLIVTVTYLGSAFQLGITGLTVGSSLVVLGYYQVRNGKGL